MRATSHNQRGDRAHDHRGGRAHDQPQRQVGRWLAVVLAVVAVGCQLAYPVVQGPDRDRLTVTIVVAFAAAVVTHAAVHRGWRAAAAVLAAFAGGGLAVEVLGVTTGFPFGTYAYADRLGPMVGGVPLIIPLAWTMLGYPALVLARQVTDRPVAGPALAATALSAWDLYLDPQMVAEGYWRWAADGPWLLSGIPASNHLAWLGTAGVMMAVLWPLARRWAPLPADRLPVALYVWTWAGSLLAHLVFLDLPRSALTGGVAMGAVVVVWARRRPSWDGRRA